ncbi:uncharacterized protein LOC122069037 [Macadamia integrifolia]|uniref:uncharacterized protein LOC122069037 n=1 Tax=Macadamia integrifolia TaxID=60698 RepID=UPI001C4FE928|nr:uncharacterized protein LOC122069037 [Macadamia integrifolia]
MPKNNSKMKSSRKPLAEISNGGRFSKTVKKISSDPEVQVVEDDAFDRLHFVYSRLSNLIQKLDPLVVQAFKCKVASKKGRKEIESFTNVLSDTYSSIELWIPRFQKVLSSLSVEFDNQLGQSNEVSPTANTELSNVIYSGKQPDLDSHVSPSPLVSWRAECTIENGRQLFLLTPLPRSRAHPSKNRGSSKLAHERNVDINALSDASLTLPSSLFTVEDTNDDLMEGVELKLKPKPNEVSNSTSGQTENTPVSGFLSPRKFSYREQPMFIMTPCLKVSPPKSCVLLEPKSDSSHQENNAIHKLTPFVFGNEDGSTSESSSGEITQSLALKYPELFGTKLTHKQEIGRQVEASPAWFISPPKTCVLMEPPDKRLSINPAMKEDLSKIVFGEDKHHISEKDQGVQLELQLTKGSGYQELKSTLLDGTPLWESERKIQTGKRPGENTLKKELWTKFEAASSSQLHFDVSKFQETTRKGFLDMLEEVSSENTSSLAKGL